MERYYFRARIHIEVGLKNSLAAGSKIRHCGHLHAIAVAISVAAVTTIATTAAVVDCYVFVTPSLDFDGAGRRRRHP